MGGVEANAAFVWVTTAVTMITPVVCAAWTYLWVQRGGRAETLRGTTIPAVLFAVLGLGLLFASDQWWIGWASTIAGIWFVHRVWLNVALGRWRMESPVRATSRNNP